MASNAFLNRSREVILINSMASFRFTMDQYTLVQDNLDLFGESPSGKGQVLKRIPKQMLYRVPVVEGQRDLKIQNEIVASNDYQKIDYKIILEEQIQINMPQVIVTPHIAFYSKEAEGEIIKTTIENIKGFMGNQAQNLVK